MKKICIIFLLLLVIISFIKDFQYQKIYNNSPFNVYIDPNFSHFEKSAIRKSIIYANNHLIRKYNCCLPFLYNNPPKPNNNLIYIRKNFKLSNNSSILLGTVNHLGGNYIYLYPDNLYYYLFLNNSKNIEKPLIGLILH